MKINDMESEDPIRGEIFSQERLEQYASFLAEELLVSTKKQRGVPLLPRVKENEYSIKQVYLKLSKTVANDKQLSPAGEWILDNYHIVEDQIREIKEDLPDKYYLELPKVKNGRLAGHPRVYAIALALVAHLDSRMDILSIKMFVEAFQKITPLLIGEIWAIPIAIRIALLENLRRLSNQVIISQEIKDHIEEISNEILDKEVSVDENNKILIDELSLLLGISNIRDYSSISQLSHELHTRKQELHLAFEYIDKYLSTKDLRIDEIVHLEHQFQAVTQTSISNAIISMKLLSNTDWEEFFESQSLVEPMLNQDPVEAYQAMDFTSRDQYRNVIEHLHKKTGYGEVNIAKAAISLASKSFYANDLNKFKHHVGYYLIRKGVKQLKKDINYRASIKEWFKNKILDFPTTFYLGGLTFLTILLIMPLVLYLKDVTNGYLWSIFIIFLTLIPASDSCLNLLNLFLTYLLSPTILPKIDLPDGIPRDAKTFVIIPTIITNCDSISRLFEDLEIRYLGNQDENLFFAILSDFSDAATKDVDSDQEMMITLKKEMQKLNLKYKNVVDKFYLFHRERLWNQKEKTWMGWERKRGKIHEFNRFLRQSTETSFILQPNFSSLFLDIQYVITLDTDTKLPRNAARRLVGTILHPLNRPHFDEKLGIVTEGYSILQPRISVTPESSGKSIFAQIFSGHTGIDPYTTAVSDTYQDLFNEGIYTGKGLYVVDTFESSLDDRVPENTLLSHDLFEGLFARAALVSDIEFLDDYPSHYESFAKRNHRWIRGDWQLIKWIFPWIPNSKEEIISNPLRLISRWKIIDNLRRSLIVPLTFLWFIFSWTILPGSSLYWTFIILTVLALPIYAHSASKALRFPHHLPILEHLKGIIEDIKINLSQLLLSVITLPYQAYLQLSAILTSLFRVYVSKRNLLEWTSAAKVESDIQNSSQFFTNAFKYSWSSVAFILLFVLMLRPEAIFISSLFLFLWMLSPYILNKISQAQQQVVFDIQSSDREVVRQIALRTWNFFERFVTEKENWLPPDNFQQDPVDFVAQRTSPTNMGLYLLSCCSAHHFGYIGSKEMIQRLEQTLIVMEGLPRLNGHFYNWYDTSNRAPLIPEYISTVDSGNLAGHLLAVKQICLDISKNPTKSSIMHLGIFDIIKALEGEIEKHDQSQFEADDKKALQYILKDLIKKMDSLGDMNISENVQIFDELSHLANTLIDQIYVLIKKYIGLNLHSLLMWSEKLSSKIGLLKIEENFFLLEVNTIHLKESCSRIIKICNQLFSKMDFAFLYDKQRMLFSIGYNVKTGKNDESFYDLLASEARLASFISIAKGDIPEKHWFHLGRQMTSLFKHRALISWSASMFEYLMPLLVMKNYAGTLLSETNKAVVKQQIAYAQLKKLPWGVSESAFNARDLQKNYQYGPFGVPGLGLKRGLSDDFVVSPYSTALAILVLPKDSLDNFKFLIDQDFLTDIGFFEAIDYTEGRIPPKEKFALIQNFMAHHQGMIMVALDNFLHENIMVKKFHENPIIKSSELLLQERIPQKVYVLHPREEEVYQKKDEATTSRPTLQHVDNVQSKIPQTRIISNGNYTTMLTATGSGFSKKNERLLFKWEADATLEKDGNYIFVRNNSDNSVISTTFQPFARNPKQYKSIFSEHKAEFIYNNQLINIHTEVIVSAEDNVEMKRVTFSNLTNEHQSFDIFSYGEITLATNDEHYSHPAFNKLFIETEYIEEKTALLAKRRKRSIDDGEHYAIHQLVLDDKRSLDLQFETDRAKFLGRRNSLTNAACLNTRKNLSNTVGTVLDPIFAFKTTISFAPYEVICFNVISGIASSRDEALGLIDRYHDPYFFEREDQMSWTQTQIELKHLNIDLDEANTFQKLSTILLYSSLSFKSSSGFDDDCVRAQNSLWGYGISGDLPILLVSINSELYMSIIKDLLQFHEYLKMKNIKFDLVFFNDEFSSYRMLIHEELLHQIRLAGVQNLIDKPGGIFLLKKDLLPREDQLLFESVSRIYLLAHHGSLKKQVDHFFKNNLMIHPVLESSSSSSNWKNDPILKPHLQFFNGLGGFYNEGEEYQIYLDKKKVTPAPWINVIANSKDFGFLVSESGSTHTWSQNSKENRLTPWSNDPVLDPSGEIIYLCDQDSHDIWSPTPGSARDDQPYLVKHGQGYSTFEHNSFGISQNLTMYVSLEDEVKFVRLKLKNLSDSKRKLSVSYYMEWVLGTNRGKTSHFINTQKGPLPNSFITHNHFDTNFGKRITYIYSNKDIETYTCSRASFIGRYGSLDKPLALNDKKFDEKLGRGLDPCLAMKMHVELEAGAQEEILFLLGQEDTIENVSKMINKNQSLLYADTVLENVNQFWKKTLSVIKIKTPYPQFDILINHWMLYQTLSCRIWARTAFYQSGGAYGFRDQLQDVTSLLHSHPNIAREHILMCASKQFEKGDVLHWWHPPLNKGVRTHFSDDLLWLPYVVQFYIETTGDEAILDEIIPFIDGPELNAGDDDLYIQATQSENKGSLFEHCLRAIDHSLKLGEHQLPLMGSGDWNDGMNKVGSKGQGESIWLGWFLGSSLAAFSKLCEKREDQKRAFVYQEHLQELKISLEETGWDGQWYRRAYFDDGTPLGSQENSECQIDSIAQSWSILSSLGSTVHINKALASAKDQLVDENKDMVYLFQPPFDKTNLEPGYIKGYPPGIRENGGQYTHAAIWLAMAYAKNNDHQTSLKMMTMLNPIMHSLDTEQVERYKGEPYVIAADVYSSKTQMGMAGWTWYTGSASWYYRAFIESILGVRRRGDELLFHPIDDENFFEFEINYCFGKSHYHIAIEKTDKLAGIYVDDKYISESLVLPLVDDNQNHVVIVKIL